MSNEKIRPPTTSNNIRSPKLKWHNSRIRVEFKGSCVKQVKVTFTPNNVVNLFIVYELDRWSKDLNADLTLKDFLFGAVKFTKNAVPDKYSYSRYSIGFDSRSHFLYRGFHWGKNFVFFGVDNSSWAHTDNKKKDMIVLGEGPPQELDGTTIRADATNILLIFQDHKENLVLDFIIIEGTVFFLLVTQKYINPMQKTLQ